MPTRYNRWFLLQILLLAQHVSGTTMPIIRSSRVLYRSLLLQQPANRTHNPQLHTIPTTWKAKHQIPKVATFCIILSSSWCWAKWCPKHVEQAIRSAIKSSVASSWHFISTYAGKYSMEYWNFKIHTGDYTMLVSKLNSTSTFNSTSWW